MVIMSRIYLRMVTLLIVFFIFNCQKSTDLAQLEPHKILHIIIMSHLEGDRGPESRNPISRAYQSRGLPDPEWDHGTFDDNPSFIDDVCGLEIVREFNQQFTDSFGNHPKLWVGPIGEVWQTEADPEFGGKLFRKYDYINEDGYEFGSQCHPLIYSGTGEDDKFFWEFKAHTPEWIRRRIADTHMFAEKLYHKGQKVNAGYTLTPAYKVEYGSGKDLSVIFFSVEETESMCDHFAYELGYRITLDDYQSYVEDRPSEFDDTTPVHYVYLADYDDGVQMVKLNVHGQVYPDVDYDAYQEYLGFEKDSGPESVSDATLRFDRTLTAMKQNDDPKKIYYFGWAQHPTDICHNFLVSMLVGREVDEYGASLAILRHIQKAVDGGEKIKFVTPLELAQIFSDVTGNNSLNR